MATTNEKLQSAYDAAWIKDLPNSKNCSGFIKSLGKVMGFSVPDKNADGIIASLEQCTQGNNFVAIWEKIANLDKALLKVQQEHKLVLVAATASDYGQNNGHIAVLLPKVSGAHEAPLVYGGAQSEGARSQGDKTIRQVWNPSKHNKLRFFAHRNISFIYE
jgi:hypothetical protein